MNPNYSIKVLERVFLVLDCFTIMEPEKSLADISRVTGLHKSTVFRIFKALEEANWIRQDPQTGLYRLGFGIFELGNRAVNCLDIFKISRSHLENLVKETGQSAHLVIHDNGEALYLNKLEHPGTVLTQPSNIGTKMPLHCTAVGKVLLAFGIDSEEAEKIIDEKGLKRFTPNTICDKDQLRSELEKVKQHGYALDNEEIQIGLRCIAAPLIDCKGNTIAAISISGLTNNFKNENLPFLTEKIIMTAQVISRDLGYIEEKTGS